MRVLFANQHVVFGIRQNKFCSLTKTTSQFKLTLTARDKAEEQGGLNLYLFFFTKF